MKERRFYYRWLALLAITVMLPGAIVYAQPLAIHIPDPNLRATLRDALNLPAGTPITQAAMRELTALNARDSQITDVTGLEYATNLTFLQLLVNGIEDVSPLANLTQLTELHLGSNQIEDISPLANLTQLTLLRLNENWRIEDISPLDNLTQLKVAHLDRNVIVDVSPLARLTKLESLDIRFNRIVDVSPLDNLTQLTELYLGGNQIENISPLANLTQLAFLRLNENWVLEDISPLENLTQLTILYLGSNQIEDISPLENLTQLTELYLGNNQIEDISSLANLTQLTRLFLSNNRIVDVSPLAKLTHLDFLDIRHNNLPDYTTLDGLSLSQFFFDQTCDMPPLPLEPRLENRNYPSIFARWSGYGSFPATNRRDLSDAENLALHDLRFGGYGLPFLKVHDGYRMGGDVNHATHLRDKVLAANPNVITLATVSMRGEGLQILGEDWPYWIKDEHGNTFLEYTDGIVADYGLMDFTHPAVQDMIVQQAVAVSKCGLFDGIVFDYWSEAGRVLGGWDGTRDYFAHSLEEERQARLDIVRRIRAETRPHFLIMGNTNVNIIPKTGMYINGGFMETGIPRHLVGADLEFVINAAENALSWLENNLREPRINGLEGFSIKPDEPLDSPNNRRWMRALTTLSLTHSDGYVLYSQNDVFTHHWYEFWDADLGRPVGGKATLYDEDIPGLYTREYTNGWAVYNHSGQEQEITLPELVTSVASGVEGTTHTLPNLDGEMYLRAEPVNPADVNGDGLANILDLILVAQAIGTEKSEPDVNGDGVINVFDLVMVAGAIGGGGAAPSVYPPDLSIISAADVARWLALAQGVGIGDAHLQRGIRFLEGLLAALTPKETTLLPNYPNPFNPETWIPYRLAREAEVAITVYDAKGTLVRRLALGNQAAGYYAARGKAAYWDGRNEDGETVASGIYIYQFRAGDYAASRRMVIVK